jgi:hypothetical protein
MITQFYEVMEVGRDRQSIKHAWGFLISLPQYPLTQLLRTKTWNQ